MARQRGKASAGRMSIYTVAGLFAAAGLLAGLIVRTSPPSAPAGPLETVTIATNTEYAGSCPVIVAHEKAYFAREAILAAIQPHTSGKAALDATLQGRANLATSADLPIMFAVMRGESVSVVATIFGTERDHGIVGRRDRGIGAPASLQGKRIGVTLGTSAHFFLDASLNRQKLSANDVTIHDLKPEELSAALARGDIDAVATWEPYLAVSLAQLGGNGVIFSGKDVYEISLTIAGVREYVVSHPQTIQKVLRALVRGGRFCRDEPHAAQEIVARTMKTDPAKLRDLWPSYRFNVSLDQSLVLALEDETRWAIRNKLTGRTDMPNYLNHLYLDALRAVAPAAVTVIH